jgi:hypothetical protein
VVLTDVDVARRVMMRGLQRSSTDDLCIRHGEQYAVWSAGLLNATGAKVAGRE